MIQENLNRGYSVSNKSWHLDRRTFLRGTGVSLGVPFLSGMAWAGEAKTAAQLPRRLCCFYFPFGVSQTGEWGLVSLRRGEEIQVFPNHEIAGTAAKGRHRSARPVSSPIAIDAGARYRGHVSDRRIDEVAGLQEHDFTRSIRRAADRE